VNIAAASDREYQQVRRYGKKGPVMNAYHNDPALKERTLEQMRAHQRADQIVQGHYWSNERGCAVGCLTHDPTGGHAKYPELWGIPEPLAYLEDTLFESLSVEESKGWPVRFLDAIPVGADLSRAWDKWQAWCLRDLVPIAGENAQVVAVMAVLFERAGAGDEPSPAEWNRAARAAEAAEAAGAAEAAWAAWAARAAGAAGAARVARVARAARDAWAAGAAWDAWDAGDARVARAAGAAWTARAAGAARDAWDAWASRACDALVAILEAS
jgi:hypothetical protein